MNVKKVNFSLKNVLHHFTFEKESFSSYDAYYSARMLLIIFYDIKQKNSSDFHNFVLDIALEHFNQSDLIYFKNFLKDFERVYKTLFWRLKDVSINQ